MSQGLCTELSWSRNSPSWAVEVSSEVVPMPGCAHARLPFLQSLRVDRLSLSGFDCSSAFQSKSDTVILSLLHIGF